MKSSSQRARYEWFMARPGALRALRLANALATGLVYVSYCFLCFWLLYRNSMKLIPVVLVPGAVFAVGSAVRAAFNRPRPYDNGGVPPLLKKETVGKSFPSRHAFCAAVIAAAFGYIAVPAGLCMALIALVVCALRVVGGVHYVADVAAGAAFGGVIGVMGFALLGVLV